MCKEAPGREGGINVVEKEREERNFTGFRVSTFIQILQVSVGISLGNPVCFHAIILFTNRIFGLKVQDYY